MNLQPITIELVLPDNKLIIILWNHEMPGPTNALVLNFHMQDQYKKIPLEDEFLTDWALVFSLLQFGELIFND
jgi:hypothetical protein